MAIQVSLPRGVKMVASSAKVTNANVRVHPSNGYGSSEKAFNAVKTEDAEFNMSERTSENPKSDCLFPNSDDTHDGSFVGMIVIAVLLALLSSMVVLVAGGGYLSALGVYCIASLGAFVGLNALKLLRRPLHISH